MRSGLRTQSRVIQSRQGFIGGHPQVQINRLRAENNELRGRIAILSTELRKLTAPPAR